MKVVPKAMYHLIMESIAMNKQSITRHDKQVFPDSEFIYNLIPDPDQVLDRYDIPIAVICYGLYMVPTYPQHQRRCPWKKVMWYISRIYYSNQNVEPF